MDRGRKRKRSDSDLGEGSDTSKKVKDVLRDAVKDKTKQWEELRKENAIYRELKNSADNNNDKIKILAKGVEIYHEVAKQYQIEGPDLSDKSKVSDKSIAAFKEINKQLSSYLDLYSEWKKQKQLFDPNISSENIKKLSNEAMEKYGIPDLELTTDSKALKKTIHVLKKLNENITIWNVQKEDFRHFFEQFKKNISDENQKIVGQKCIEIYRNVIEEHQIQDLNLTSSKHVEAFKDLNNKLRGYLENRSYLEKVIVIDRELSKIKPVEVKLSRTTQMIDWAKNGLGLRREDHRPERVNEKIGLFKETVRGMLGNIADLPPGELKDTVAKTTLYFIQDFQKLPDQAVRDYGKGEKGRQSRQYSEYTIDNLNRKIQQMNTYLESWKKLSKEVTKIQAKIKATSSSNDAISNTKQSIADKLVKDLESGYKQALNNLKDHYDAHKQAVNRDQQSLAVHGRLQEVSKGIANANESIKNTYSQLEILRDYSDEWRKVNDMRAQIKAAHNDDTEENIRIKHLSDKILNGAENAFDEVRDNPRELTNAYDKLKETGRQLEILRDYSDEWRKVNDVRAQLEAVHSDATQGNTRIKQISDKMLNRLQIAFDEIQNDPRKLTNAYDKLKETGRQLRMLRDHPDKWRQANDIQAQLTEATNKWHQADEHQKQFYNNYIFIQDDNERNDILGSFKQNFNKAEGAYKELSKSGEEKRNWPHYKKLFDDACQELKELSDKVRKAKQDYITKPNDN